MIKTLVEPPLAAPVSLADVKSHLRFDRADEDDYLAALVLAATTHVERRCDIALMTQTWRLFLDDWPCGSIVSLPLRPVREIAEVRVYDGEGNAVVPPSASMVLDPVSDPARLHVIDKLQPLKPVNGIEIDLVAGFGDTANDVPDTLRRAILVLAAFWFEVRGSATDASALGMEPAGFDRLLAPWRRTRL
ncbi:MAG: phage head-tail connector protein [Nitratireductor sp.]|nr:phage head-tail connector protein [Nitratireductor sp.]MCB1459269.1 phage head-tail connector protein [Nitratireductor sp.]